MSDEPKQSTAWKGVQYLPAPGGVCSRHGVPVEPFSRICIVCHREQLQAAYDGGREWEQTKP